MNEDFYYDFTGFGGAKSKCHIRFLNEDNKPIVIICSQLPGANGTSVMNAFEILYSLMQEQINNMTDKNYRETISEKIDEYSKYILETKSMLKALVVFLLQETKKTVKKEKSIFTSLKEQKNVIWIEHWPKGTAWNFGKNEYSVVIPYGQGPKWQNISLEEFSDEIGYSMSVLEKDESIFEEYYTEEIKRKIKYNLR